MNLYEQVCSLELAKKLKELKVKQKSYFWWVNDVRNDSNAKGFFIDLKDTKPEHMQCWSAFTVSELSQMLPKKISSDSATQRDHYLIISKFDDWHVSYSDPNQPPLFYCIDDNLANNLARVLIHILENGLIKND